MVEDIRVKSRKNLEGAKKVLAERMLWQKEAESRSQDSKKSPAELEEMRRKKEFLFEKHLYPKLSPAKREDYLAWYEGYVANGGSPTIYYRSSFECLLWYIANEDLKMPVALHDEMAVNIIVPEGVDVADGDWGENKFFKMDNFEASGSVPIFEVKDF